MSSAFEKNYRCISIDARHFGVHYDETWCQGPGAFGGVVFASLIDACMRAVDVSQRPLRTLHVQLCRPAKPGKRQIDVDVAHAGSRISHLRATMRTGDNVEAFAAAMFGVDLPTACDRRDLVLPSAPAPDACAMLRPTGKLPRFIEHLDIRLATPERPGDGFSEAHSAGWVRLRESPEVSSYPLIAALLDTWWPSILVTATRFSPVTSVTFDAHFVADPKAYDPSDFAFLDARSQTVNAGYSIEADHLWSRDGTLLAVAQQSIVIIK